MTICDFCHRNIFAVSQWDAHEPKYHHSDSTEWEKSLTEPCSICSCLLETVQQAILQATATSLSDWNLDPIVKHGVLLSIRDCLPIFKVSLDESASRDHFVLTFRPVPEKLQNFHLVSPLHEVKGISIATCRFLVFATKYDERRTKLRLKRSTNDKYTLAQLKQWMTDCNEQHAFCHHLAPGNQVDTDFPPPTRLLDITLLDENRVRLVETNGEQRYTPYATLSHCWGGRVPIMLLDANYNDFISQGLDIDEQLPKSFREAVHIARELGIRYLWIDSLCIIQDNKGRRDQESDWTHEAHVMHKVYGGSYLNIAAASAHHSREGLFRQRRAAVLAPSTIQVNWKGQDRLCRVIKENFWDGELLSEPLYSRAWAVQERLLSPRTIHFGTKQVFWQCLTMNACETMPTGIPNTLGDAGRKVMEWRRLLRFNRPDERGEIRPVEKLESQRLWREAVSTYTKCDLTKKSDKLPAIGGLAQAMAEIAGEYWVAGLWNRKPAFVTKDSKIDLAAIDAAENFDLDNTLLVEQLAWKVVDCKTQDGKPSKRQARSEYRAPSWSWASVDGVIELRTRVGLDPEGYHLKIIEDPKLELAVGEAREARHAFGELRSGSLRVEGLMSEMTFSKMKTEDGSWKWVPPPDLQSQGPWCYLYPDEPLTSVMSISKDKIFSDSNTVLTFQVLLLFVSTAAGRCSGRALAVQAADDHDGEGISRLGLIEFQDVAENLFWHTIKRDAIKQGSTRVISLI